MPVNAGSAAPYVLLAAFGVTEADFLLIVSVIVNVPAVPPHECFDAIAIRHNEPGREHHFSGVLQVPLGNEIFQVKSLADRNGQHQEHNPGGRRLRGVDH